MNCMDYIKNVKWDDLNTQLAFQCAPLLSKIKISNILIINVMDQSKLNQFLIKNKISGYLLSEQGNRVIYFLYQKDELTEYLQRPVVADTFNKFGKLYNNLLFLLEEIAKKYQRYMERTEGFPHEIGLLLGYPAADVCGFIENQGKNFLYSGYWKVYSNLPETLLLFSQYNSARKHLLNLVMQGIELQNALDTGRINYCDR